MKKNTIINLAFIACFFGGILFAMVCSSSYCKFFGGFISGPAFIFFCFEQAGRRQLDAGAKKIDKIIKDNKLANVSDNDDFRDEEE